MMKSILLARFYKFDFQDQGRTQEYMVLARVVKNFDWKFDNVHTYLLTNLKFAQKTI